MKLTRSAQQAVSGTGLRFSKNMRQVPNVSCWMWNGATVNDGLDEPWKICTASLMMVQSSVVGGSTPETELHDVTPAH